MRTTLLAVLILAGCPRSTPPAAAEPAPAVTPAEEPPAITEVRSRADLERADGLRVAVSGTVTRGTTDSGEPGTAVQLDDGAMLWVGFGEEPPHGWEWLLGMAVRVQGSVVLRPDDGPAVPVLDDPDAPMPADGPGLDLMR